MLCLALQSGFQFLGLFDHRGNLLVTAGSAGLLHKNSKLALLKNRSRIDNGT